LSVFGRIPTHIQDPTLLPPFAIRALIIQDFRNLLFELEDVIRVKIPKKRRIVDVFVPQKNTQRNQTKESLAGVTAERLAAQEERTLLRTKRASQMLRAYSEDLKNRCGTIGCIVSITTNKRDHPQGRGMLGIVFAVSKSGGCCVITKHGRTSHGKVYLWVPVDRYKVLSDDMPIEEELSNLRDEIQNEHLMTKPKKIVLATAFRLEYETAEGKDDIGGQGGHWTRRCCE
jgi:hypothetical protein